MRTTTSISISLPRADLRRAQRLAKRTNRSLSGLFREGLNRLQAEQRADKDDEDEYTPEQRRLIDAQLAEGLEQYRKGLSYGPFDTAEEAIAAMKAELKKRAAARRARAAQ